jgi:nucleotide-binding universal stress UspA family protein
MCNSKRLASRRFMRLTKQIEERLGRRLRTIAGEFAGPIRKGRCLARIGRAFDEICQVARRLHADLIVTVTHGYTGLKRALIGSTAECIVRHAPCPVLVVREKEREFLRGNGKTLPARRSLRIRHILVSTDFSEHSRIALQYAVTFAERFGAKLTLLNVLYPQYFATSGDYMALDYPNLLEETRRTARRDFNEFVRNTASQGTPFQTHIEDGHPGQHYLQNNGRKLAPLVPRFNNGAG